MQEIDWLASIFFIVGGLGLFLYGIHLTGESLKLLAGSKLKRVIEKTTNTPFKGIIMGIVITVILQTSSGTTALTISLVRAGLMTLPQAAGIILGANVGTTVTSFLIGLNIAAIALPMIGVGSMLSYFISNKKYSRLGGALMGFGMIFYGLEMMGDTLKTFVEFDMFEQIFITISDWPVVGVVMGAVMTFMVQSSTAVIGILQSLYETGAIPIVGAIAIILGSNIGTTITAFIAAIGGSVAAKRTAVVHIIFNTVGTVVFLILIYPYSRFILFLERIILGGEPVAMTLSFAHIFFNLLNTFIMFFFITQLVKVAKRVIPGEDMDDLANVDNLQERLIKDSPPLALESAKKVVMSMGDIVITMFKLSVKYSFENDKKALEKGRSLEEIIDTLDQKTHDYLVKLSQDDLDDNLAHQQSSYVEAIRDFERIADHCQNLFEFFEHRHENKQLLDGEAATDLATLYNTVEAALNSTYRALRDNDKDEARKVIDLEETIDHLVGENRKRYVARISDSTHSEALFVDILSNVERIGDHCENIANTVLYTTYFRGETEQGITN